MKVEKVVGGVKIVSFFIYLESFYFIMITFSGCLSFFYRLDLVGCDEMIRQIEANMMSLACADAKTSKNRI